MPRFLSRPFAVALLSLAGLAPARATLDSVRYLVPVTYNMVITRVGSSSSTTNSKGVTTETSTPSFEIFGNKDLLKLILNKTTDADVKGWSLYAVSDSETFADPKGLETLQLIARKKDGTEEQALPEGMTFSLSLSDTRTYSSSAVHDGSPTGELLTKRDTIAQIATLTQALPLRGEHPAGTLTTTGYVTHGIILSKVKIGSETTADPVDHPTSATYRAAGTFDSETDSEDGLAEVLISFGTPKFEAVEAPPLSD